jgi:hypothetical protein
MKRPAGCSKWSTKAVTSPMYLLNLDSRWKERPFSRMVEASAMDHFRQLKIATSPCWFKASFAPSAGALKM